MKLKKTKKGKTRCRPLARVRRTPESKCQSHARPREKVANRGVCKEIRGNRPKKSADADARYQNSRMFERKVWGIVRLVEIDQQGKL